MAKFLLSTSYFLLPTMLIDRVFRNSLGDIWEESAYLLVFNLFWLCSIPFIFPFPFATFGLFAILYDIGQSKSIKFSVYFKNIRNLWQEAAIWGGINLLILFVAGGGLYLLEMMKMNVAILAQAVIVGLMLHWSIVQLYMLAVYPRLEQPSFSMALRYAVASIGSYLTGLVALLVLMFFVGVLALIFYPLIFVGLLVVVVAFLNRLVEVVIAKKIPKVE